MLRLRHIALTRVNIHSARVLQVLTTLWETQIKFLEPGFGLAQLWLVLVLGE